MTQRLHLVFGGELVDPTQNVFKDVDDLHIVGMFPDYASAYNAWKSEAHRTVDNAHMRYFIAHRQIDYRCRDYAVVGYGQGVCPCLGPFDKTAGAVNRINNENGV